MRRHNVKWTLFYLKTGTFEHFDTLAQAKIRAFECEGVTPVSIRPPIYG